jgi:hypothetical protein
MSFRIEEKLYIRRENLLEFKAHLFKNLAKKLHHPRIIKSLYFENKNLDMFNDSIEGLTPRKKIRIRNYPNEKDIKFYLEIKNSAVEGRFKTRNVINDKEFSEKKFYGILDNQYGTCFPKLYVSYLREYFLLDDVRISIDENIEYADYSTNLHFNDQNIIVELKTSIKKNLNELIEDFPMQRIRFSKYCLGVENLYNLKTN